MVANRTKVRLTQSQLDEKIPVVEPDKNLLANPKSLQVTWIGHASALVQVEGVNFLTDPVWSQRCSPIGFIGPQRIRKTPLKLSELPPISFVVISHDHYDHLDIETVKTLGNNTKWYVPIGLKSWFNAAGVTNVVEMTWWERQRFNENIEVVCVPCQHWSKRTLLTNCKSLWSSWIVMGKENRVYFSGDTGYCPVFKKIGNHFGPFDLSLIAIGAYEPRWFMKPQHVNPDDAVKIHQDIKSILSLGIHWGTFILTDEPEDEPPMKLTAAIEEHGLKPNEFIVTKIGETKIIKE